MISSILQREFSDTKSVLNIVWTPCEDIMFQKFIMSACAPCNIINLDDTYYGMNDISIILCNNRIMHMDKAIELSKFLFSPLLIIDHDIKSNIINNEIDTDLEIDPVYNVALSKEIYLSWNKIQNIVLQYEPNNQQNKNVWRNLIFQLSKSLVVIKDDKNSK